MHFGMKTQTYADNRGRADPQVFHRHDRYLLRSSQSFSFATGNLQRETAVCYQRPVPNNETSEPTFGVLAPMMKKVEIGRTEGTLA